ncbi:WD40/YVTN/BNR-like repeat-containing protein [Pseudomonas sp. NPDC096917]|uniref:WD40/YVTN/BNR-like repeat-containing protein n=1 Tax=Pseudomonas sp. NPDC096917 TaxID=3364483 RepID=UPI00383B5FE9
MNNKNNGWVCKVLAGVIAGVLATGTVAAGRNAPDTLEQKSVLSALASHSALNAAAMAGERMVVAGVRGHILYSDDQGQHWQQANVPVTVSLTGLCFADSAHGWAVGHRGVILVTRDGGKNWTRQLDGVQAANAILHARQDPDQLDEARRLVAEGADKPFLAVHCISAEQALAVGAYGLAFSTRDAGRHWQPALSVLDGSESQHLNSVQQSNGRLYLAGEQGTLMSSGTDLNAVSRLQGPYDGSFFGLLASGDNSLLVFGLRGNLLRSVDQGSSWQTVKLATNKSLTAATELRNGSILLADESGQGWISRDDGRSFRAVSAEQRFPLIALLATPDGGSLAVGTNGITRFPPSALR